MTNTNADKSLEYRGETSPRRVPLAVMLTLVHPGLGYLYVGKGRAAAIAIGFFTLYLVGFIGAWAALKFFPLLPLSVFVFGWLIIGLLCLPDVVRGAKRGSEYVLRPFNHPVVYALVLVMFYMVPLYAAYHVSMEVIWGVVQVNDDVMTPSVEPGDVLLVDRTAFWQTEPAKGDMVVVSTDEPGERVTNVRLGRVIAVGGDSVKIEDDELLVNEQRLSRQPFRLGEGPGDTYIEQNAGKAYLVAGEPTPPPASNATSLNVESGQVVILGDNRRLARNQTLQAVPAGRVVGRPSYLLYSDEPGEDVIRWERIGLRVR